MLPSDDLIQKLRDEMEAAAEQYRAAKQEYDSLVKISEDLGGAHPDGEYRLDVEASDIEGNRAVAHLVLVLRNKKGA